MQLCMMKIKQIIQRPTLNSRIVDGQWTTWSTTTCQKQHRSTTQHCLQFVLPCLQPCPSCLSSCRCHFPATKHLHHRHPLQVLMCRDTKRQCSSNQVLKCSVDGITINLCITGSTGHILEHADCYVSDGKPLFVSTFHP